MIVGSLQKLIQEFFKENYLNQVFTHPYTPQENGHIESFRFWQNYAL
jgi:transposase InsO family protein